MILVLIPTKPTLHSALMYRSVCAEARMLAANSNVQVVREFGGSDVGLDPKRDVTGIGSLECVDVRMAHLAPIRQAMVEKHLRDEHSHVMWLDADVCDYPADLPAMLTDVSHSDIVAPAVYHEGHGDMWHDIAGFVENGKWFKSFPPYCKQTQDVVFLDSVGAVYIVPADVYRNGGNHRLYKGYTDHYSVCQDAISQGRRVLCDMRIPTYHADLSKYL